MVIYNNNNWIRGHPQFSAPRPPMRCGLKTSLITQLPIAQNQPHQYLLNFNGIDWLKTFAVGDMTGKIINLETKEAAQ